MYIWPGYPVQYSVALQSRNGTRTGTAPYSTAQPNGCTYVHTYVRTVLYRGCAHVCTYVRTYSTHTGELTGMHTGRLYTVGFRSVVSWGSYTYPTDMCLGSQ